MKPEDIKAGRTYKLEGTVNSKDGLVFAKAIRKVISIDGDTIVFDKDGVPTEGCLKTFANLAKCEVSEHG